MEGRQLLNIIDTHAHLDEIGNPEDAIRRAAATGIKAIIAVGQNHDSNIKTMAISKKFPNFVYPAFGLHPWHIGNMSQNQIGDAIQFIEEMSSEIIAIGEIGMDYDKRVLKLASKELQKETFAQLLNVAKKQNKPVIIHSRYAWKDCFNIVKTMSIDKALFHWYTGSSAILKEIMTAGYYVSVTPAAEYHDEHRCAVKEAPLIRLMLETDSPVTYGRVDKYKSEPKDVVRSLKAIAAIKGITEDRVAKQTLDTTLRFFNFDEYKIV